MISIRGGGLSFLVWPDLFRTTTGRLISKSVTRKSLLLIGRGAIGWDDGPALCALGAVSVRSDRDDPTALTVPGSAAALSAPGAHRDAPAHQVWAGAFR